MSTTINCTPVTRHSPAVLSQAALLKGLSYNDLPVEFVTRILEDSAGGNEYKRIANCSAIVTRPANSSWLGSCCASLCCSIGFLVQDGNLGVMRENADFHFLAPGYHAYPPCGREVGPSMPLTTVNEPLTFGTLGFLNVAEGSLGLIMVGSTYKLLAPGIYQWHAPQVKFQKVVELQDTEVSLGPYKLITVPEGSVAVTFHNGNLRILGSENPNSDSRIQCRTFFLDDVKWTFSCMLPTVMQTDRLEGNDLLSKDNVELLMVAMSQWRIVDPVLAVTHCAPDMEKIRSKVNQLVRATIARIVAGTNIGSGPVSGSLARPIVTGIAVDGTTVSAASSTTTPSSRPEADLAHLMQSEQATKHMRELTAQMTAMGIDVLGVYVPEKRMKNDDIRSQVAKQAVIGIRAEAERAAADATAYATVKAARAQAEAIELVAAAHAEAGRRLGEPEGTSARLALSESMSKSLKDARLTIFSGAPSTIPFMFTADPAAASSSSRPRVAAPATPTNAASRRVDDLFSTGI